MLASMTRALLGALAGTVAAALGRPLGLLTSSAMAGMLIGLARRPLGVPAAVASGSALAALLAAAALIAGRASRTMSQDVVTWERLRLSV